MNEPLADVPMKPPPRDLFILSRPRSKRQSYPSTVAHIHTLTSEPVLWEQTH